MSLKIFSNLTNISDPFKGILLDAYGVFWNGNSCGLIPGSREVMEKLIRNGKIVGILSNSTQLAAKEIDKLRLHGLQEGQHFHFLLTSGEIARKIFIDQKLSFPTPKKRYWPFCGAHPKHDFHEFLFKDTPYSATSNPQDADFIYISVPHIDGCDQKDPFLFRQEIIKLKEFHLPMVCANPDRFAHEGNPPTPVVRQGSIAALYEELGGEVYYIGKPSSQVYSAAMDLFSKHQLLDPKEILMVGDTPETDIRGARNFGMKAALITETGISSQRISNDGLEKTIQNDPPDYCIKRLASLDFELHPNLANKTFIVDLPLCRVLLEDEQNYPWILLIPRRPHVNRLIDLNCEDQLQFLKELDFAQKIIWELFHPTQLNVAAIGNKTAQLHMHIIARYGNDPAWPQTVWDHAARTPYSPEQKELIAMQLKGIFSDGKRKNCL